MASQRRVGEPETVNPMVDDGPTEGVARMADMFQPAQVVDEVQETPARPQEGEQMWVIRPSQDVEDMTLGNPHEHYAFKAGTRYKVNIHVAAVLYNRELLMEQPYPYDPAMARR
jgi:hypothetical protein